MIRFAHIKQIEKKDILYQTNVETIELCFMLFVYYSDLAEHKYIYICMWSWR